MREDPKYKQFVDALNLEIRTNWYKRVKEFAETVGISQGQLSKISNSKSTAKYATQLKIAQACGFKTVDDFISPVKEQKQKQDMVFETQEDWALFKAVKQFKNKDTATRLNGLLVELESLDFIAYAETITDIAKKIRKIKEVGDHTKQGEVKKA